MKKVLLALGLFLGLSSFAYAGSNEEVASYNVWDTDALSVYYVFGGTETAASFDITNTSVSFTTAGGLAPGTSAFLFTDTAIDTIGELKSYIEGIDGSTSTTAMEGTWSLTLDEDIYSGEPTINLDNITDANVHKSSNACSVQVTSTTYFTSNIPARRGRRNFLSFVNTDVTFGTGTSAVAVYDGTTQVYDSKAISTGAEIYVPSTSVGGAPIAIGSGNTDLNVRVTNSAQSITAGYITIGGYRKR